MGMFLLYIFYLSGVSGLPGTQQSMARTMDDCQNWKTLALAQAELNGAKIKYIECFDLNPGAQK